MGNPTYFYINTESKDDTRIVRRERITKLGGRDHGNWDT